MTIAAMKQVLEFLEQGNFVYPTKIADDLRAAISEQEKCEPVARVTGYHDGHSALGIEWLGTAFISLRVGDPLYTHPAPVPAGEVVITTTESGECVAVTRQDEEGRILKVLWER